MILILENNQDNQEKRTKKKKTNYVLTPARKAQLEKMNQDTKKKIEEKRKLQSSEIIEKKYESLRITSSESSTSDGEFSKNSESSDETMIISGFDDDEPNKEAVIKINKKKSKAPNKKIIENKKIESDIEEEVINKIKKKNINEDRLEKKKRRREIKNFFDKNKKKILENTGEIDDMSYLELY